jgi:hypothetical protein
VLTRRLILSAFLLFSGPPSFENARLEARVATLEQEVINPKRHVFLHQEALKQLHDQLNKPEPARKGKTARDKV